MDTRKSSLKYELLLLVMSIIWGSTFVAQQIGMAKGVGPMTYNGLRFALGCLSLVPVILWRKKYVAPAEEDAKLPVLGSLLAGLFLFGAASFQQIGLQYTTSANSGFITGFYILFVPLLGLLFRQKVSKSLWIAIPICLYGFYLLSVTSDFKISKGDVLTLVCAVLWACQILVIDHVASKGDSLQIACLQFALCAVLSVLSGLFFEHCTLSQVKAASGAIAYGGLMSVGIAFTLQVICQKRCPPAPAAIIMSLEAVFAAIAGYLVLNQELTVRAIFGCVLIFVGVVLAQVLPLLKRTEGKKRNLSPLIYLLMVWGASVAFFLLSTWLGRLSSSKNEGLSSYFFELACFCLSLIIGLIGIVSCIVGNALCLRSILFRLKKHVVIVILLIYIPVVWILSFCLSFGFFLLSVGCGDVEGWSGAWYGLPISIGTVAVGTLLCLWRIVHYLVLKNKSNALDSNKVGDATCNPPAS